MLSILMVTTRQDAIYRFISDLASDSETSFSVTASGAEALESVRSNAPHLVIVDSELQDMRAKEIVQELLMINAMVNTAVMSPLSEQEFHEACEGLGVLARLPLFPGKSELEELLHKLRMILGMVPVEPKQLAL